MSQQRSKRQKTEKSINNSLILTVRLPEKCKDTVTSHINTIYVGTVIRIYDPSYGPSGQVATVHWATDDGLFVTSHTEKKCIFVDLKYKSWVVDHTGVRPGALKLFARYATNDIEDENRNHTINEKRQRNSKILMNDTLMDYPRQVDRDTYSCCLFRLTCNCGCSKKALKYTCSESNTKNGGKVYYGCPDRYRNSDDSCNSFVWKSEVEHGVYMKCQCGQLCKKVNISRKGSLPVFKFVCINRNNKLHQGCNVYMDV